MLIFHEGLPGSGKSYESLVQHIIPSLKNGRKVFARINGLNHEKIAELCEIDIDTCRSLLVPLSEDQVMDVYEHVENDSLVVLDELQNFFPSGRSKLSDGITKFVTEHRHRGLDILAMGQSLSDVHNLWRRRTQRKIQFLKLDMVGSDKRYKWIAFQGQLSTRGDIAFTKLKSGVSKYDPIYFGSYASHESDTENTINYVDDRTNVLKSGTIKYGLPVFLCLLAFAIFHLSGFFGDSSPMVEQANISSDDVVVPVEDSVKQTANGQLEFQVSQQQHRDFIQINNDSYQHKITYLELKRKYVWDMIIVWHDKTDKVVDRVTSTELKAMGYKIKYMGYGVQVTKDNFETLFRFKPQFEPAYSISDSTRNSLSST